MKKLIFLTAAVSSAIILISAARPDHSIISAGTSLIERNGFIYASAGKTLYRLNRKTGDFSAIYSGRTPLYRFEVNSGNTKALCIFEGDPHLHYLQLGAGPVKSVKILMNKPQGYSDQPDILYFTRNETRAVICSSSYGDRAVVFLADLTKAESANTALATGGAVIAAGGDSVVYLTHSKFEYGRYEKSSKETLRWRNIFTGAEKDLYVFPTINKVYLVGYNYIKPTATAVETGSPEYAGVRINDPGTGTDRVLIFKDASGTPFATVESPREINGGELYVERALLSADAMNLIFEVTYKETPGFRSYIKTDLKTGKTEPASDEFMSGIRFKTKYRQHGNTLKGHLFKQNEGSDILLLVDKKKRMYSETNIKPLAKTPKVEWGGLTYFYTEPDEFYTAIEKGGGRYFMRFPFSALKTPDKPVPDGQSVFEFIQRHGR